MNIRKADISDAPAICKICTDDLGYKCSEKLVLNRLKNIDGNREAVFAAEIDDTVVGYIHAEIYNTLYFQSMINILGLAVSLDYRRQGIGRALLSCAENWAKEHGINIIRLNSSNSRKEAHEFYRAMGYDDEKLQVRFLKNLN
ncbi:MAG: GNAT family N-acetyltransferase [Oscillospiraceae bacterium]|nr:GNAT family N-acetyltransferase [Oscillospiraceae bacterium]